MRVSTECGGTAWDAFLAQVPGSHHAQSSAWAKARAADGWSATRLTFGEGPSILAGAQVFVRARPWVGAVGYLPRGPVFASSDRELKRQTIGEVLRALERFRIRALLLQPAEGDADLEPLLLGHGFRAMDWIELQPQATVLVDLDRDLDDVLGGMRKKTRQYIRRSERSPLEVRLGNAADLETFHRLLEESGQRLGYSPESLGSLQATWQALAPGGHGQLFLVELGTTAVAGLFTVSFGDRLVTKRIGWSGDHGEHRPNEALYWAAIRWARERGLRACDLDGIDLDGARALLGGRPLPEELKRTPTFFKTGFGGRVVLNPGVYLRFSSRPLRSIHRWVDPLIGGPRALRLAERLLARVR